MPFDLDHFCLQSNPQFDNVSGVLKVHSDMFEDVPYTTFGRCRRSSKLSVGPKIYVTLIQYIPRYLYTMHGNCRTGSKLSDNLQSRNSEDGFDVFRIYIPRCSVYDIRTDAADAFRRFPKILPNSSRRFL